MGDPPAVEPLPSDAVGRSHNAGARSAAAVTRATPLKVRLGLQRQASSNLQRHVVREAVSVGGLLAGDVLSFLAMRALVQAARDGALLGDGIASMLQVVLARGILNGWQFGVALIIALVVTGSYASDDRRRDPRRLFIAATLATAMPMWTALWTRSVDLALLQFSVTTASVWLGLLIERFVTDSLLRRFGGPQRQVSRTLFVGTAVACREALESDTFATGGEYHAVGFVDSVEPPAREALGHIADLPALLHDATADTIVVCGHLDEEQLHVLIETTLAAGCRLLLESRVLDATGTSAAVVWQHGRPLFEVTAPGLRGRQLLVKRAVDIVGAVAGLILSLPIALVVAVAIKVDSRGPVIFPQDRVTTGGRRFRVFKFRTMRPGVSDEPHRSFVRRMQNGETTGVGASEAEPVYKLMNDERVTRLGRWLRRTSLDELPQLWNVLRGDMSLVGPRPPLPYELEAYDHWQFDRLRVKPGLTGLWQVSGRSGLTYRRMCELDVQYVREWSLWLDLKIMLKTVPVVLFNSGRAA